MDPAKARHRPQSDEKPKEKKKIDGGAAFSVGKFGGQRTRGPGRRVDGAEDHGRKQADPVGGNVHQKPRQRNQHRARAIKPREEQSESRTLQGASGASCGGFERRRRRAWRYCRSRRGFAALVRHEPAWTLWKPKAQQKE